MAEKDIERKLKKRVEALGCMCLKFESPGYTLSKLFPLQIRLDQCDNPIDAVLTVY